MSNETEARGESPQVIETVVRHKRELPWFKNSIRIAVIIMLVLVVYRIATWTIGWSFPDPFGWTDEAGEVISDVTGSLDGFAESEFKEKLDKIPEVISQREAEPLVVDLNSVTRSVVSGQTAFGRAERSIHVGKASKKYDTWVPRGDEWINLCNIGFLETAYVPGPVTRQFDGNLVTMTLPPAVSPATKGDVTITQPAGECDDGNDQDDPQLVPEIGQVFGSVTSPEAAVTELYDWVTAETLADDELFLAATCWGMESLYEAQATELVDQGLNVEPSNATAVVSQPSKIADKSDVGSSFGAALANVIVPVEVEVGSTVELQIQAMYVPESVMGPPTMLTRHDCVDIIAETNPDYDGPIVLDPVMVELIELAVVDKGLLP